MTEEQKLEEVRAAAEALCRVWQKILRLEDWDIEIELARYHQLGELTRADVSSYPPKGHAVIRLIQPGDDIPDPQPRRSTEYSIIHELLHLHLGTFTESMPEGHPKHVAKELTIDRLAQAYLMVSGGK